QAGAKAYQTFSPDRRAPVFSVPGRVGRLWRRPGAPGPDVELDLSKGGFLNCLDEVACRGQEFLVGGLTHQGGEKNGWPIGRGLQWSIWRGTNSNAREAVCGRPQL